MRKFVNLHAHSCFSILDALSYPQEHIDAAYEKGLTAHAITDHGNMNGMVYQFLHSKEMAKKGKIIKPIYGAEMYFVPDLEEWRHQKNIDDQNKKKKSKKQEEENEESSLSPEDEEESRTEVKSKSSLNKRYHLLVLAKNKIGLHNLFSLVSKSYMRENFYRKPRIDFQMLREHKEGLIISSACMSSYLAAQMYQNADNGEEVIERAFERTLLDFQDIFGDDFFAEIQFNAIEEQKYLNKFTINAANKLGIQYVVTTDVHYPRKELWKDREIYKRLGWLNKTKDADKMRLPESLEEVKCELFIKNGDDVWESYQRFRGTDLNFYFDDEIEAAIERTFRIAHECIEDIKIDTDIKLPSFIVPKDANENALLRQMCEGRLRERGLFNNKEYVDRLNYELSVIEDRDFGKYFLTMKAISNIRMKSMASGPGRGSASGSLVNYLLQISQVDPIRFDLQFERFLRSGAPAGFDASFIDSILPKRSVDKVFEIEMANNKKLRMTESCLVKVQRNGQIIELRANELAVDDELLEENEARNVN